VSGLAGEGGGPITSWQPGDPTGEPRPDASEAFRSHVTDASKEHGACDKRETRYANDAGRPQARPGEVRIPPLRDLVEPGDRLCELGRDHGDQPIAVWSRKPSDDQRRAQLALGLIGLREPEQYDLAFLNHRNASFRSVSE
jgi:hypothetical protein